MFSIQVRCNVKVIKRLYNVQNSKKTIELSNMAEQALKLHMKSKKYFENAETMQFFFNSTKKANGNNEISTVHMPDSSQIQKNKN